MRGLAVCVSTGRKALADGPQSGPSCWPSNVRDSMRWGGRARVPIHLHHHCLRHNISHNPTAQNATSIRAVIITSNFPPLAFKPNVQSEFYFESDTLCDAWCVLISAPHFVCRNVVNIISFLWRQAVYHPLVEKECLEAGIYTEMDSSSFSFGQ